MLSYINLNIIDIIRINLNLYSIFLVTKAAHKTRSPVCRTPISEGTNCFLTSMYPRRLYGVQVTLHDTV